MTFPDTWFFCSETNDVKDLIRQIGNAVPCRLGIAIEQQIFQAQFDSWKVLVA